MNQDVINYIIGGFAAMMAAVLGNFWSSIKELQAMDRDTFKKVSEVELLIAGTYVKREEFTTALEKVSTQLGRIEDKIDKKVDK